MFNFCKDKHIKRKLISRSEEFHWVARISREHSHLTWPFPPCLTIPTLHNHSHLISTSQDHSHIVWPFSPHVHLVWPFPPCVHVWYLMKCPPPPPKSHLAWPFPPCMTIPTSHVHSHLVSTSCDHSHLTCMSDGVPSTTPQKVTLHNHSYLMWPFSPCMTIPTLHLPHVAILTLLWYSHLVWAFPPGVHHVCPLHAKIIFSPHVEKFPKKSQSNPNSTNKVPLTNHR